MILSNLLDLTATGEVSLRFGVAYIIIANVTPPILPFDNYYHNITKLVYLVYVVGHGRHKCSARTVRRAIHDHVSWRVWHPDPAHIGINNIAMADFPLAHRLSSIEGESH